MSSLKQKTVSGIKWTMAASIAQRIISFVAVAILARILSPADFGLFALAFVMIDGFGIFKSLGFDSALVRRKDSDIERACNTAFFLIPAMGMILFAILFFFAPIGAKFLNNPQVTPLIRTLGLVFIISTLGKVPQSILYRDMKFKYRSIAEVVAIIVYTATAIILALNHFGVWSLVVAYILRIFVQISLEWFFSGWKPKFEFDRQVAWEMFHFGKFILGSGVVAFLYGNLDNIVVGKFLGVVMLGYYALSLSLSNFLSEYLLGKIGTIMYPAYSRIHEDSEDVKRIMIKSLRYVSALVFPFTFTLFVFAPDILRLVFGDKWLPATDILRILCFAGLFKSLGTTIWPIFLAKGQSKVDFQVGAMQAGLFFVLIVPLAINFKLIGVGLAVLLANLISFAVGIIRARKLVQISLSQILYSFRPAAIAALLMLCGSIFVKFLFPATMGNLGFFVAVSLSFVIYVAVIHAMDSSMLRELKNTFSSRI